MVDPQHPFEDDFPRLAGRPDPPEKVDTIQHAVGKTIDAIEFGRAEQREGVHDAEAIVLHFTDDTALSIEVGSNTWNLSGAYEGLSPGDFSTDLMVFWRNRPRPDS